MFPAEANEHLRVTSNPPVLGNLWYKGAFPGAHASAFLSFDDAPHAREKHTMAIIFRKLRAQNFNGFADTGTLDFGELNLFLGPNSAGKSSLLHVLVLLKQTFEDPNPENRLITDGGLLELGSFTDVLFRHDVNSSLCIDLGFGSAAMEHAYVYPRVQPMKAPDSFSLELSASQRAKRIFLKNFSLYKNGDGEMVHASFSSSGVLKTFKSPVDLPKRGVSINFYHFVPTIFWTGRVGPKASETTISFLNSLIWFREVCRTVFSSLIYLQPIRTPIKTMYRVTGESPVSVGATGEDLLGVLYRDEKARKRARRRLLEHLNYWLYDKFGLVRDIQLEPLTKAKTLYALTGRDSKTGTPVNLAAVGFGVSQVAPIIVQGFLSPPNSCLLIEQPEIHLHPAAQAELGDLFIDFTGEGKQLFIETHSQYLLYRVQRRIAEGEFDARKVRVFFVSRTEQGSKIENLNLDDRGRIANWPPGFFEEGYVETAATAEALVK